MHNRPLMTFLLRTDFIRDEVTFMNVTFPLESNHTVSRLERILFYLILLFAGYTSVSYQSCV